MRTIPASKGRTHFYSILDDVERGESISITRKGKPIARIIPEPNSELKIDTERVQRAIDDIKEIRKRTKPVSIKEIISMKNEGRILF